MSHDGLKLTATVMDQNPGHTWVCVWQNGGKAGELCVDTKYADQILALLNGEQADTPQAPKRRLSDPCLGEPPDAE